MCWDSCVFIRYLTRTPLEKVGDIEDFIKDAQQPNGRKIWFSTLVFAEIRTNHLATRGYGTVMDFIEDMEGAFEPINPDPNIMMAAARLHEAKPTDPSTGGPSNRTVGTPDAIHLATCLHIRDVIGVSDVVFHSFDYGRGRNWEGRCVGPLAFEQWFPNPAPGSEVEAVCQLSRLEPAHPQPRLT